MLGKIKIPIIFLIIIICYGLTNYGGIRSPDNEITFRVGQSIASHLHFSIDKPLSWQGFGVARGKDGRYYSVFGPLESITLAPLIKLSDIITHTNWFQDINIPPSHYVNNGLKIYLMNHRPDDPTPHALRFIVSYLYILISFFGVIILYLIMKRFASTQASIWSVTLFALGTIGWGYSGTLFSEPLATLLVLISFYFLIRERPESLPAGIFLGLATMAHITSILFAPFFFIYLVLKKEKFANYLIGFIIPILLLGIYNYSRFGDVLETGRTASLFGETRYIYSYFIMPWRGLYGLLFSGGKGLLIYTPAVIFGIIGWRSFHRKDRILSFTLIGAIIFRLIFIASRSDWPGGFSLGPRYLLMIIPFLILPVAPWLDELSRTKKRFIIPGLLIATFLCIMQQFYLNLGEIFSYFHIIKFKLLRQGIDAFQGYQIYFDWRVSPLFNILKGKPGPLLLNQGQASADLTIWLLTTLIIGSIILIGLTFCQSQIDK